MLLHLFLFAVFWHNRVFALHGQVDDDDNDVFITFIPEISWVRIQNTGARFGTYRKTQDPDARAVFKFTGIGFSLYSPLFPNTSSLSTIMRLDSGPPYLLDLTYPALLTSNTSINPNSVVWSVGDLENTLHTLTLSVGLEGVAIADCLEFITPGPEETALATSSTLETTTTPGTSSLTTSRSPTTSPAPSPVTSIPAGGSSTPVLPIALGIGLGVPTLLIIVLAVFVCIRKRKKSFYGTRGIAGPILDPPEMAGASTHIPPTHSHHTHPARDSSTVPTWDGSQPKKIASTSGSVGRTSQFGELNVHESDYESSSRIAGTGNSKMVVANPSPFSQSEIGYSNLQGGASEAGASLPSESSRTSTAIKSKGKQPEDHALMFHVAPPAYTPQ